MLPKLNCFNQNSAQNAHQVKVDGVTYYFSYETCVAFQAPVWGYRVIVSENVWSVTTGKHLNWVDCGTKEDRIDNKLFEAMLERASNGKKPLKAHLVALGRA